MIARKLVLVSFVLFICNACNKQSFNHDLISVVTGHKLATEAAYQILEKGGSAADALVTASLMLSNVEAQSSGLGGGFMATYYDARTNKVYAIDAREAAPSKVEPDVFLDENGKAIDWVPERVTSGASVGIPGTASGLDLMHSKFGSMPLDQLLEPVINVAENGFKVSKRFAVLAKMDAERSFPKLGRSRLSVFPSTRKLLFKDGKLAQEGDLIVNKDYAHTLKILAEKGFNEFYTGDIAKTIVKLINNPKPGDYDIELPFEIKPSQVTMADFKNYKALIRKPIKAKWRTHRYEDPVTIYSMGPPSSGATTIIEALNLFDNPNSAEKEIDITDLDTEHRALLLSEFGKAAFKDRNAYLGDEDFIPDLKKLKHKLIDPDYADKLRKAYLTKPFEANSPKEINHPELLDFKFTQNCHKREPKNIPEHGTSHLSISDGYGNVLSATLTIEWIFGNGMVIPGYGFLLNNELTDFDPELNHCNSIAANKRPRSSMSPTIVMHRDKPIFAVGASGGWTIIGSTLQTLISFFEDGLSLEEAIKAPRLYNAGTKLLLEEEFYNDPELISFLKERTNDEIAFMAKARTRAQALMIDQEKQKAYAMADARGQGFAISKIKN